MRALVAIVVVVVVAVEYAWGQFALLFLAPRYRSLSCSGHPN